MKTYLRGHVITRDDVWEALSAWSSGESGRKNSHRILEEYGSDGALVDEIYAEVRGRNLTFRPIRRYRRTEPVNGKVRVIGISSIKQQVCDYLVCTLLKPLFDAKIGFYQVACVKGKGQGLCRTALRKWVRDSKYHVKLDIRQCYPSMSHDVVMRMYRRYVGSEDVLYVIESILGTYSRGLEIGSYFSMMTMQLVISFIYHHVEGLHKTRRGRRVRLFGHQIWHMDDALLTGDDKRDLRAVARAVERFAAMLGLSIKPWKVARTSDVEPLDLGGWVVRRDRVTMREGTFLRGTRAFARFGKMPNEGNARRCVSYWGWFVNGDNETALARRGIPRTFARARRLISRHTVGTIGKATP